MYTGRILDKRSEKLSDACVEGMSQVPEASGKEEASLRKASDIRKENESQKMVPCFLWCEGSDNWTPYSDEINDKLERRYQKIVSKTHNGRTHVNIHSAGRKYQIYVANGAMSQMNVGTRGSRKVKRVIAKKIALDWTCGKCTYHNTSGQPTCFACSSPRSEE